MARQSRIQQALGHAGDDRLAFQAKQNEIYFVESKDQRIAQIKRQILRSSGEIRSAWRDALRREQEV